MKLKQYQVIMLSTYQKTSLISKRISDGKLLLAEDHLITHFNEDINHILYDLYVVSDEEIKEGDWIYCNHVVESIIQVKNKRKSDNDCSIVLLQNNNSRTGEVFEKFSRKIIASTEYSLEKLDKIPDSFIKVYIKVYNGGNLITHTAIDYESTKMKIQMFNKEYESIPTIDGKGFTLKEINKEKSYRWEDCVKKGGFIITLALILTFL